MQGPFIQLFTLEFFVQTAQRFTPTVAAREIVGSILNATASMKLFLAMSLP